MMVEVFKTNISEIPQAEKMIVLLKRAFPICHVNFDLEDCDKILRVESLSNPVKTENIVQIFSEYGFQCEVLADLVPDSIGDLK